MFASASVSCSCKSASFFLYSSCTCFSPFLAAAVVLATFSSLADTFTSITMPVVPLGTRRDVSFTSAAFSPKMARNRRSSGASSVSLLGVILPTRISPGFTSAPTRTTPSGPRSAKASSPTFGISRVISSGPSLVSRAATSYSEMCTEVNTSSFTMRREMVIASSKL